MTMFFAAMCLLGCASQTEQPTKEAARKPAKPGIEPQMAKIEPIEGAPKLTEDALREFEENCQHKLPEDYRRFLLQHNGGFPSPDCVTFKEAGRNTATDVFCFHSIGDERPWASMEWHQKTFSGRLPENTLPIAHDSCGNLWLLNVGPSHAGSVAFWDHGTFGTFDETHFDAWPRVAESFQEFIDNLHEYSPLPEDKELLSRYALVQKAIEGMAKGSSDFHKHSVLDGAWHCHYEDGHVKMQCVDYVVHAVAAHTDGYSELRAAKGFIKAGPARLPE
jgi:hypothetical protein